MPKPEEFFNFDNIFNSLGKGIDFYKVVSELPQEQQQELFNVALFIRRQQELEADALQGLLSDKDLQLIEQVELAMNKYSSRLKQIIKLSKENSSWL